MPDAAELVRVADAITAELTTAQQDGAFVDLEDFTPERSYADWANDLDALEGLRVDVVPVTYEEAGLLNRGTIRYLCSVDVGVRRWFDRSKQEGSENRIKRSELDRLILFVQELHEFFCKPPDGVGRRLATYEAAVWQDTKIRSTYSRKHLHSHRMFLGLLRVQYATSKDSR